MFPKVFTTFTILLLVLSSSPNYGYEIADIDSVIQNYMNQTGAPGVYFSLVNGLEMFSKGYGFSDVDNLRPADDRTRVFIASVSKSITALTVCRVLNQEFPQLGESVLNIPIMQLVPSYNFTLIDRYRTEKVTFRDLLSHRTCLNINSPVGSARAKVWTSLEDFIYRIRYQPEQCEFRSQFLYSGKAMPTLAGDIVAHIARTPFPTLVKQTMTNIGMLDSLTMDPNEDYETMANVTKGYYRDLDGAIKKINISVAMNLVEGPASAGILSTSADMARYLRFHVFKGNVNGFQVVQEEILNWVHKVSNVKSFDGSLPLSDNEDLGYALGLEWGVFGSYTRLGHKGSVPPFTGLMYFYPELRIGLYTATNGLAIWETHYPLHKALMEIIIGNEKRSAEVDYIGVMKKSQNQEFEESEVPRFKYVRTRNAEELVGLYGHPYEGDVKIFLDGDELKLEYGLYGKGILTPSNDTNEPNTYVTLWDATMESIFVLNDAANLLTRVKWDFNTPDVLKCIFPGGSLDYGKDATIDKYAPIPWECDESPCYRNCVGRYVTQTFLFFALIHVLLMLL